MMRPAAANVHERFMIVSSASAVESYGEHERTRQREVEVVDPTERSGRRSTEVRLGIEAGVLRPGLEVSAGQAKLDGRHVEQPIYPRGVEHVAHRDLTQFHVAAVLDAWLVDAGERTGRQAKCAIPVLTDRELCSRTRSSHRARIEIGLTDRVLVAVTISILGACARRTNLRVLVRAVAQEGA